MAHCSRPRDRGAPGPCWTCPCPGAWRRNSRQPRRRGSARATLPGGPAAHPPGNGHAVDRSPRPGSWHRRVRSAYAPRARRRRRLDDVAPRPPAGARWPNVRVTLLDRLQVCRAVHRRRPDPARLDTERRGDGCVRLAGGPDDTRCDVVFANLFLHHFPAEELRRLCSEALRRVLACSCAANPGVPPWRSREATSSACWGPAV